MRKVFRIAIMALSMMATTTLYAQVSHGGEPLFNHSNSKATTNIHYLPTLDNDVFIQQDMNGVKGAGPMRVSIGQACDIDIISDGKCVKDAEGLHYTIAIQSPGATYVSLRFSKFNLAEGAELYVYDQTGEFVLGKFVKSDMKRDGRFYTQAIPGSTAYIEYNVPAGAEPGELVLSSVMHGYKDIFQMIDGIYEDAESNVKGPHGSAQGTCHPDVICPEGDDWRDQIRSVVALELIYTASLTYNGRVVETEIGGMCSGAIINNTRQDKTPYILSAFHCQDGDELLDDETRQMYPDIHIVKLDVTAYFLYEKRVCNGSNGVSNLSMTGADTMARYDYNRGSDMWLLRLQDTIPNRYKPYYAGWDRNTVTSHEPGACIHHPGGDYKKISIPASITAYPSTSAYKNFYKVGWITGSGNKGVTEQGSSGSPLFNADKRIVGQLFAGTSYCSRTSGEDEYGRLSVSWEGGSLSTNRLKDYLDPNNTGVTTLNGLNYDNTPGTEGQGNQSIEGSQLSTINSQLSIFPNPSNGLINFDIDYIGKADYKVYDLSGRCVKEGSTVLTSTVQSIDLRSLAKGSYTISLYAGTKIYSAKLLIK